jgi:hypothetical protein
LAALARSVDLLIVVTDVNSHGAVQLARREARQSNVPVALYRRCSPARLSAIVAGLDAELPLAAGAGG